MQILILQDYLRSGGTERQSVLLANAFAAAGHATTLLTFRPGGALRPTGGDLDLRSLQPVDLHLDWFAPGLGPTVRKLRPDVILCMGRMANCYSGHLQRAHPDEKFAIARLVADQVQPGMTVILDGGSTTYAVARLLADKHLQVITNSLPIASLFGEIGSVETIVTGGSIYSRLGVLVGPLCEQSFEQTHADLAILGGAGITENGIWTHNALIVAAQRKMIGAAERTIFALDNSKFGRKALSLTTPFDPRFTIVTDTRPTPSVARAIIAAGAKLTLTK